MAYTGEAGGMSLPQFMLNKAQLKPMFRQAIAKTPTGMSDTWGTVPTPVDKFNQVDYDVHSVSNTGKVPSENNKFGPGIMGIPPVKLGNKQIDVVLPKYGPSSQVELYGSYKTIEKHDIEAPVTPLAKPGVAPPNYVIPKPPLPEEGSNFSKASAPPFDPDMSNKIEPTPLEANPDSESLPNGPTNLLDM
eukprot:Platyproteum_vivax@DN14298_c0_g1_i1.p1